MGTYDSSSLPAGAGAERAALVFFTGTRGKTTSRVFVEAMGRVSGRALGTCELTRGEGAELQPRDVLVVADTRGDPPGFEAALGLARGAQILVLDAMDPAWVRAARELDGSITWIGTDASHPVLAEHLDRGGDVCLSGEEGLVLASGPARESICSLHEIPALLGGTAHFQVRNVLAAVAAGVAMNYSLEQLRAGLAAVGERDPLRLGRGTSVASAGLRAIFDRVPDLLALESLVETAACLPAERRRLLVGERDDIHGAAWNQILERLDLDSVWISPGPGREALALELAARGVTLQCRPDERTALEDMLEDAAAGDCILALRMEAEVRAMERVAEFR